MPKTELPDELNPDLLFNGTATELLLMIARGEIDPHHEGSTMKHTTDHAAAAYRYLGESTDDLLEDCISDAQLAHIEGDDHEGS